jgi:hypothetical protein
VRVQTIRESLGGPWYARLAGWLLVFPAVVLLVLGQDSALRSASVVLVLVSALLQHVVGGAVFFAVARVSNLRWDVIPIPIAVLGWLASGVTRGVVGGLFAFAAIGIPPDLLFRVVTWVLVVSATQPLITYLLSQVDHRRALLGQLDAALTNLRAARKDARQSTAATRHRLVSAVRDTIDPVMWEVRSSLRSLSSNTEPELLNKIGEQLEVIGEDIDRILSDPHLREVPEPAESAPRAQLIAAVDFPPSHFVLSVTLPPLVVLALLAPEAWRSGGVVGIEGIVAGVLTSSGVLALAFLLQLVLRAVSVQVRLVALRIGFVFAGLAASTAAFITVLLIGGRQDETFLYVLPISVAVAAAMVMGALGISVANRKLALAFEDIRRDDERLRRSTAARDRQVTAQVADLLHGPVIGRLSACVMAINFRPAELGKRPEGSLSPTASRVLSHLEAVALELDILSSG